MRTALILSWLAIPALFPAATATEKFSIDAEFQPTYAKIQQSRSLDDRKRMFLEFQKDIRARVDRIPASLGEEEIDRAQNLFEIDLFVKSLRAEDLNPVGCEKHLRRLDGERSTDRVAAFVRRLLGLVCRN